MKIKKIKPSIPLILFFILIAIFIFFSIIADNFLTFRNISSLLKNMTVMGIMAVGLTPLMIAGRIDLSFGANLSLTTVFMALLYGGSLGIGFKEVEEAVSSEYFDTAGGSTSLWLVVIIGILIATAIGAFNGLVIEKIRVNPLIFTLAMLSVLQSVAFVYSNKMSIFVGTDEVYNIGELEFFNIPVSIFILFILLLIYWFFLKFTKFGRTIYAVGSGAEVSQLFGINVKGTRIILYTLVGFFTGIAAIIVFFNTGIGSSYHGELLLFPTLSGIVLGGLGFQGGKGSIISSILGVLILAFLVNGLKTLGIQSDQIQIIQGAVFIGAVSFYAIRERK